ncbi:hypothetical protein EJB05_33930 [Eragrostis curvula]|uniref:BRCT domain-containing protein n=1 Tax=Eragrostis curvula TaxID=38414 RepID=A0A5J9U3Y6_9POAL|nr:hypothetical protein EJB05_33921 [Eragrostis curvula]TVU17870.1 hypothetical protein EJB05_33930 [Eragrostis curvula]
MAGDARDDGGDNQVLDGGTPPSGSPVSDGGDTQSESDDGALDCETKPMDDAETQLVDEVEEEEEEEEEEGVAPDWVDTQLVESGEEDGGDYGEQVETQLEVEHDDEDAGRVEDNACNGNRTQMVAECKAKGVSGSVHDIVDTQLVEESEEEDDDDGVNGDDEVDVGEWGKTQLVEDSDEEMGDDEFSEGTQVLTDNESLSDYERDVNSGLDGGFEATNAKAEMHVDCKSVVDSDASTDEEGDAGHLQMKSAAVRAVSLQSCGLAEAHDTISVNTAQKEKQKASNHGIHLLPKIVDNSYSTSFRDLPDCGIDSDSHGYVQNHDKDGTKGRDKCSTAKKLFAETMAEDGESNSRCFPGLSYIGSQEPGDLSQANAFEVVDRLISVNGGLSSQESTPNKLEMAKPRVSSKRGTLILAEKVDFSRSSNGKAEIFEWVDSREDDGGGDFFIRNKDNLLKKSVGRGKQKSHSARTKKSSMKISPATNKIGESKSKMNSKLCRRFETVPLSDSRLLKIDVKSKRSSGNRTKKNLLKDLDDLSNARSLEGQEKADIAVPDVGPDTQMAVEAMEALAQCSPSKTLPAKGQPPLDKESRDGETRTATNHSKNGLPQKRTSSVQQGVTTRSKRRKVPESVTKPRKERHTELKMQEKSELPMKTQRRQAKSVPEKRKDLNMFSDENKYHGTPVAHRTRRSSRNNLCENSELCSNKCLRKDKREIGDGSTTGEVQNNCRTNVSEKPVICDRITEPASSYFEKESTEHTCANSAQDLQSSRDGSKHNRVNNIQNLEPRSGEATAGVACSKPLSHPKQRRTPTAMVPPKVTAVIQTAADHEIPPEVPRQSKKRRVFVRSVSDLLKYAKREPSSGRSTSMLTSIIGKSLAGSPILNSSVRVDSKTSDFSGSAQQVKESPRVENSSKSPKNNAQDSDTVLKTPSKVVNDLSPTFSPVNPSKASSRSLLKTSVARELLKLDPENSLSNQQRKDSRRRKDMASFSILFSHHLDEDVIKRQKKILARLGVREAFSIPDATHFVADSFFRTRNMLEAIALGKPVVTSMWLENCGAAGCYIDERKYILSDVKKEKELGFSMPISLASACKHPLLLGKRVFITSKVKPSREVMICLVKASSGQPLERVGRSVMKQTKLPDDLLVISSEEDYQTCAPLLERGASVFSSELVLHGIIIQHLDYDRHRLFTDRVKQTRSTRWLKDTVHDRFVPVSKRP